MKSIQNTKSFPDKYLSLREAAEMFCVKPNTFVKEIVPKYSEVIFRYKKGKTGKHYKFSLYEVHEAIQIEKQEQRKIIYNTRQYEKSI